MTKKQKTWLIIGIIGTVLTFAICFASAFYSLVRGMDDWKRELMTRSEAHLSEVLDAEKVDAKKISLHKEDKEYWCRAEVYVTVNWIESYVVYFEKPSEDGEWILSGYEDD